MMHRYYNDFVLEYLRVETLTAGSALVRTLRDGRRVVYKKDLKREYPYTKEFLFEFSRDHPSVLAQYRHELAQLERRGPQSDVDPVDEPLIARSLIHALSHIPTGLDHATSYHKFIVGVIEFLFFPALTYPRKEVGIHDGRKRIDVVMENSARSGLFEELLLQGNPCTYVFFECKNYGRDVANPELDQLGGRFSRERGKVGFLCCRAFRDRDLFIARCRDTWRDDRGLIMPLEDETIGRWLELVAQSNRQSLDRELKNLAAEIRLN